MHGPTYIVRANLTPFSLEMACCECCEKEDYVTARVKEDIERFPSDGIFNDNVIASYNWEEYYTAIADMARSTDRSRAVGMNLNCASGEWPPGLHHTSSGCSPYCDQFDHSAKECANCRSPRCANLTESFFALADVHIRAPQAGASRGFLTPLRLGTTPLGNRIAIKTLHLTPFTHGPCGPGAHHGRDEREDARRPARLRG